MGVMTFTLRVPGDTKARTKLFHLTSRESRSQLSYVAILTLTTVIGCATVHAATNQSGERVRPFTVAEDIGLTSFDDPISGRLPINVSPNGRLVAVRTQRGVLEQNLLEDELRVYDVDALRNFVLHPEQAQGPKPIWSIHESTYSEGVLITDIRWLRDSNGLAFLSKDTHGKNQLLWTDLKHPQPYALSTENQDVMAFDVRDALHYIYTVRSTDLLMSPERERTMPSVVATGRSYSDLFFPEFATTNHDRSDLWAAVGGRPHPIMPPGRSQAIAVYYEGQQTLALSPDGNTVATALPVKDVPAEWENRYGSSNPDDPYRIHSGHHDPDASKGTALLISQYVTIDLRTGLIHSVAAAPTGLSAHWVAGGRAATAWSDDGRFLALPGTFIAPRGVGEVAATPCLAVSDVAKDRVQCLSPLRATYTKEGVPTPGYYFIDKLDFAGSSLRVLYRHYDQSKGVRVFTEAASGEWQQDSDKGLTSDENTLDIFVRQGLNNPPVLVGTDIKTNSSRTIWDPNPQLKNIKVVNATVYHWTDKAGREWTGGLYKPTDYVSGHRYPLVIQTHGFTDKQFLPSGTMSTAFAARPLAASGIVVLQVLGCPVHVGDSLQEAPCEVAGYETAVEKLSSEGIIDPDKIGIIGFSRTCYYIMQAITSSTVRFKAASITAGVDFSYWQYLLYVDLGQNGPGREAEGIYQAKPFDVGLQQWINNSPEFKIDKVSAPLMVVGEGKVSLLEMWAPYAALRHLRKPTDLILLNTDEHILTNPAVRMASQGGSVDWFRFWLQGYEDPAAVKADQYRRWEGLCDMQKAGNPNEATYCVNSKP
jgi:dipeptidyl aminopeptidase/acylaminoacyl peptidase